MVKYKVRIYYNVKQVYLKKWAFRYFLGWKYLEKNTHYTKSLFYELTNKTRKMEIRIILDNKMRTEKTIVSNTLFNFFSLRYLCETMTLKE